MLPSINLHPYHWTAFFVLIIILIIIKQIFICKTYKTNTLYYFVWYFLSDFPVLISIIFIILINSIIPQGLYNLMINLLLFSICFHFYIDILCIKLLHCRALIPEILSFYSRSEFKSNLQNITLCIFIFLVLMSISFYLCWFIILPNLYFFILLVIWIISYFFTKLVLKFLNLEYQFQWNI